MMPRQKNKIPYKGNKYSRGQASAYNITGPTPSQPYVTGDFPFPILLKMVCYTEIPHLILVLSGFWTPESGLAGGFLLFLAGLVWFKFVPPSRYNINILPGYVGLVWICWGLLALFIGYLGVLLVVVGSLVYLRRTSLRR